MVDFSSFEAKAQQYMTQLIYKMLEARLKLAEAARKVIRLPAEQYPELFDPSKYSPQLKEYYDKMIAVERPTIFDPSARFTPSYINRPKIGLNYGGELISIQADGETVYVPDVKTYRYQWWDVSAARVNFWDIVHAVDTGTTVDNVALVFPKDAEIDEEPDREDELYKYYALEIAYYGLFYEEYWMPDIYLEREWYAPKLYRLFSRYIVGLTRTLHVNGQPFYNDITFLSGDLSLLGYKYEPGTGVTGTETWVSGAYGRLHTNMEDMDCATIRGFVVPRSPHLYASYYITDFVFIEVPGGTRFIYWFLQE